MRSGGWVVAVVCIGCVPPANEAEETAPAPSPDVCAVGSLIAVTLDDGRTEQAIVRDRDGAVLIAHIPEGTATAGWDTTAEQSLGPEGAAPAEWTSGPCGSGGHLVLSDWPAEGREITRACGARADQPIVESRISGEPASLIPCAPADCGGSPCHTWVWAKTPRTCFELARLVTMPPPSASAKELSRATGPGLLLDLDGPAGSPRVPVACAVDSTGNVWTRVVGVDNRRGLDSTVLSPLEANAAIEAAAEMRGFLDASELTRFPPSQSFVRLRLRCTSESTYGARTGYLDVETRLPGPARYLSNAQPQAVAVGSFVAHDNNGIVKRPWVWGAPLTCVSGDGCDRIGVWGRQPDEVRTRLIRDPIWVSPLEKYEHPGGFNPLEQRCNEHYLGVSGWWEVWAR